MKNQTQNKENKSLWLVLAGGLMSLALAFSMTPAFAGLVAEITTTGNKAKLASVRLQELNADGEVVCDSAETGGASATCVGVNKYGGAENPFGSMKVIPADPSDPEGKDMILDAGAKTRVTIRNAGDIDANSLTVRAGECKVEAGGGSTTVNLCDFVTVTIMSGRTEVFSGTANQFAAAEAISISAPPKAGKDKNLDFIVRLADGAPIDEIGDLEISQDIIWNLSA